MPTDLPQNISTFGADIDNLMIFIFWVVGAWFVATELLLVYALVRYRRRKGVRASWTPADTLRTSAWVLIPVVFVLICDLVIEARSHGVWETVKGTVPKHDVLVGITGRQFAWSFTYPGPDQKLGTEDDFSTVSELHVPVGKNVKFALSSVDVLHSFWVPVLRLKQDAVPGRVIDGWFQATQTGTWDIACAELCGPAHGAMRGTLIVQSEEHYDAWTAAMIEQRKSQELTQR